MSTTQRLDIQGLRALAVTLVVAFHLAPAKLPGGYIGVDVFFVISGFLITAHLLREVNRTGTVKLSEFWARRVRRLLPAALLVLIVSAIAVLTVMPQATREQNLFEIFFASIYVVNWNLAANSVDYLGADTSASIAQHYWSLSVEEQFYIVWPILILIAVWLAKKVFKLSAKPVIVGVLAIVFAASLGFSIFETARSQPSAYFITTTRAWEFAAGGLIGLIPTLRMRDSLRILLSWAAVIAILAAALRFDATTAFPGWVAIIPVAATAMLLYVGDVESSWSPQYLARSGWSQLVGDLSYSIYLWHWPLIVVFVAMSGHAPGWKSIIALIVVTVVLAALTKRFVEDPVRRAPGVLKRRVPTFAAMVAGMAVVAAATVIPAAVSDSILRDKMAEVSVLAVDEGGCFGAHAVLNDCSPDEVPTGLVLPAVSMKDVYDTWVDECSREKVEGQTATACIYPGGANKLVLFGNSHAAHILEPLRAVADERGDTFEAYFRTGCSGFPEPQPGATGNAAACEQWSSDVIDQLVADPDVYAVVIGVRSIMSMGSTDVAAAQMKRLKDAGKKVYVFRSVPGTEDEWPVDFNDRSEFAPTCVERGGDCDWTPPPWDDWLDDAADKAGVTVLDSWELVCPGGVCRAVVGGTIVYFDESHLTLTFAKTMIPWFRELVPAS